MSVYSGWKRTAIVAAAICWAALASVPAFSHPEVMGPFEDDDSHHHTDVFDGPIWTPNQGEPLVNFAASGVQLLSWIPVTQFNAGFTSASVVEGYVSPSGREYALVGLSGGTGVVEVTNPTAPVILTIVPGPTSLWRDIRTYQNYAYAVSEGGQGIQIMDLSQIDSGVVTYLGDVTAPIPRQLASHTLEVNQDSGYLYRCGGGSVLGVKVYSLANPASPSWVSTIFTSRYVHECQVVNWTTAPYAGREIAFFYNQTSSGGGSASLGIVDVTDKLNPITLSNYQYPNSRFSHQGWLSTDRRYIYLDDELDETSLGIPCTTHIIDISDLTNPFEVATFTNGLPNIDHNQYVKGYRIFQSNYRAGLRVFDATDPVAPFEVAYFDTYPQDDNPQFNSLWDNYPFLPSGIILGSDIEKGLFVWCADPAGDMNADGRVTIDDVPPFADALLAGSAGVLRCGGPDINADGLVDGGDVQPMLDKLLPH